jgi:cytochrome c oxidase assembly protein subunit 11
MDVAAPNPAAGRRSPQRTALIALSVALAMFAFGFASVPLYRLFCQVTGFGGTTQRASEADLAAAMTKTHGAGRLMSVRFDSNTDSGLPWRFRPEQSQMTVRVGEKVMAIYLAKNLSDKPVTGRAVFNVTPDQSGAYFNKIQCFCFVEQTLQPGQEVRMPVLFFVDPAINKDADNKDVQQITLSYTFYPVEQPGNDS